MRMLHESIPTYQKGFHDESVISRMTYNSFGNTGLQVSKIGFGGSHLAHCFETSNKQEGIETVLEAIKSGINYIDTAPYYGQGKAEIVLGEALKLIPRNTYYLATKVGRYGAEPVNMFDFSACRTFQSVDESLYRLGVDSFDILQVHDIEFAPDIDVILYETLPALQRMKDSGKAKYIGITGYPVSKLKEILEKSQIKIDVVLSYCRCTLFDDTLRSYIPFFKEKKVAIINAAVIGMGLLSNDGPPDWHPAGSEIREMCQNAAKFCKERNVDISKLAMCHAFSQPDIDIHLIGMNRKLILKSNLNSVFNGLSPHESSVKEEVLLRFCAICYSNMLKFGM